MSTRPIPAPSVTSYWRAPAPPARVRGAGRPGTGGASYDPTRMLSPADRDLWAIDRRTRPRSEPRASAQAEGASRGGGPRVARGGPGAPWGILRVRSRRLGGRFAHVPVTIHARGPSGCIACLAPVFDRSSPPQVRNAALLAAVRLGARSFLEVVSDAAVAPRIFEDLRQVIQREPDLEVEGRLFLAGPDGSGIVVHVAASPLVDPSPRALGLRFLGGRPVERAGRPEDFTMAVFGAVAPAGRPW